MLTKHKYTAGILSKERTVEWETIQKISLFAICFGME